MSGRKRVGGSFRGFTLIEVLVVVAIIALLVAILLPSLKAARDNAKLVICQSHLKEIGGGITMYLVDHKDTLPGPLHPLFLKYPLTAGSGATQQMNEFVMSGYINTRLRKYFGEKTFGKGKTTKEIGVCPAFPVDDKEFDGIPIYNYALNNSDVTAPKFYFGFTHGGITSQASWESSYGDRPEFFPKRLSRILSRRINASDEWLMADAFRRPHKKGSVWPDYDEPGSELFPDIGVNQNKQWGSLSSSVQRKESDLASGRPAPRHPFHLRGGFKRAPLKGGGGTEMVFFGKANTLYFDMHVAAQEGWKGTIVPYWEKDNSTR